MRVAREGDGVRVDLEEVEVELLRALPGGLRTLLDEPDPDDPAVTRLFPAAVSGDDEADHELRRLIFDDLVRSRLEGLEVVGSMLERGEQRRGRLRLHLSDDEPEALLGILNDIRLTLWARLGIDELDRDAIGLDHPAAPTLAVVDHLAWFQEELLRVIDPPSVAG